MARENNFLLGSGERLAQPVEVRRGGGSKKPPYEFNEARTRIRRSLASVRSEIGALPQDACPRDEAVAVVTLHPRYISKSDQPAALFSSVGLRTLGSRARTIRPDAWGIERHADEAVTDELFVAGQRSAFVRWANTLDTWSPKAPAARQLGSIENIVAFNASSKLRSIPESGAALLEVVLHNGGSDDVVVAFAQYAARHEAEILIDKRRDVHGLTFLPVRVQDVERALDLARFSFVRVARGMPSLRPIRPQIARGTSSFAVTLPSGAPLDGVTRAVIFDGGIPAAARMALAPWVTLVEPTGIGTGAPLETHGLQVTSALLFGPLDPGRELDRPLCHVDHVRVVDEKTGAAGDIEYYDVLKRITDYLDAHLGTYAFANISLGPNLAVDDDDVTVWTADLDKRFAHDYALLAVAAGNEGEMPATAGLNRVQPPSDGVNVLSIGASDRTAGAWQRAAYSCVGPGRRPGVVKPDGVMFGGSSVEGFGMLTSSAIAERDYGTSFASPYGLRSGVAVRAQLGPDLSALTIRALLIHRADRGGHPWTEVGWGRFESDPLALITCEDDEALVLFQGQLPVGEHLRAPIPMPRAALKGRVTISATLLIAPEVDAAHASTYTRAGLEVSFRPHEDRKTISPTTNQPSKHAATRAFFSQSAAHGASEGVLRDGGHKWEPCLHHELTLVASALKAPVFDIYYHHRSGGADDGTAQPIPYSLVVGVKAPDMPDLYDRIVRAHANVLIPLQPRIRVRVQGQA
jgi:hypothetical protein